MPSMRPPASQLLPARSQVRRLEPVGWCSHCLHQLTRSKARVSEKVLTMAVYDETPDGTPSKAK